MKLLARKCHLIWCRLKRGKNISGVRAVARRTNLFAMGLIKVQVLNLLHLWQRRRQRFHYVVARKQMMNQFVMDLICCFKYIAVKRHFLKKSGSKSRSFLLKSLVDFISCMVLSRLPLDAPYNFSALVSPLERADIIQ